MAGSREINKKSKVSVLYIYIYIYMIYTVKRKKKKTTTISPKSSPDNKLSPNKPNSLKKERNVGGRVYSTIYIYIYIHNNTTT